MMKFAIRHNGPIAIRYPRGEAYTGLEEYRAPIEYGKSEVIYREKDIVLFAYGSMVKLAEKVRDRLKEAGRSCSLVNVRFAKPMDLACIESFEKDHSIFVSMEEGILKGGMGESILRKVMEDGADIKVIPVGIEDCFIEHGSVPELFALCGFTEEKITERILKA